MFKTTKGNTKKRSEICSNLIIKTPERSQWRRSGLFIVNFVEDISLLKILHVSIVDFELVNIYDNYDMIGIRGPSSAAAASKMKRFVIIVNGFQLLNINTKRSILDIATVLDLPLGMIVM